MTNEECLTLRHFTEREITSTGANLVDVQFSTFHKMDKLRDLLDRSINLLHGGITTGNHKSAEHGLGLAVDFSLAGAVDPYFVFKKALDAGFNRVGIYWNGSVHSFHVATGPAHGFWVATKAKRGDPWKYGTINVDPSTM